MDLNYFDGEDEWDGEGEDDEEHWQDGDQVGKQARAIHMTCK